MSANLARALDAIAAAIRELAHQGMCCTDHTIVERRDGVTYWRRHEWLADVWVRLGEPGVSIEPRQSKPAKRRRRRS